MEALEDVVVLVGMLEVSTKLDAAEAMLEVAMAFALSLSRVESRITCVF